MLHCPRAEEQQPLEDGVVDDMQEAGGKAECGDHRLIVGQPKHIALLVWASL